MRAPNFRFLSQPPAKSSLAFAFNGARYSTNVSASFASGFLSGFDLNAGFAIDIDPVCSAF